MNQNKLDKAYFHHDMADRDFSDVPWRTVSDNLLRDEPLWIFNAVKIQNKIGIKEVFFQLFINFW